MFLIGRHYTSKNNKKKTVPEKDYVDFYKSIDELKEMNLSYLSFKKNNKGIKSKNKKFLDYYYHHKAKGQENEKSIDKNSDLSQNQQNNLQMSNNEGQEKSDENTENKVHNF